MYPRMSSPNPMNFKNGPGDVHTTAGGGGLTLVQGLCELKNLIHFLEHSLY